MSEGGSSEHRRRVARGSPSWRISIFGLGLNEPTRLALRDSAKPSTPIRPRPRHRRGELEALVPRRAVGEVMPEAAAVVGDVAASRKRSASKVTGRTIRSRSCCSRYQSPSAGHRHGTDRAVHGGAAKARTTPTSGRPSPRFEPVAPRARRPAAFARMVGSESAHCTTFATHVRAFHDERPRPGRPSRATRSRPSGGASLPEGEPGPAEGRTGRQTGRMHVVYAGGVTKAEKIAVIYYSAPDKCMASRGFVAAGAEEGGSEVRLAPRRGARLRAADLAEKFMGTPSRGGRRGTSHR